MNFADNEHLEAYKELEIKGEARPGDAEWQAALFLLSSPMLARRCSKYVAPREIGFTELIEAAAPWSSGEKALVKLAATLFNRHWKLDVNDLFWPLDQGNTELALEALRIRFGL